MLRNLFYMFIVRILSILLSFPYDKLIWSYAIKKEI
jgi:hypothetical protein